MNECTADLARVLGLGAEQVSGVVKSVAGWTVAVHSPAPATCPTCGGHRWHRHGTLPPRVVAHTWVGDAPVRVAWTPVRYRCVACHQVTQVRPAGLRPWQRWSPAAQQAALQRLRRLVDTRVPLDDDTWWAHPGDLIDVRCCRASSRRPRSHNY